MKRALLLHHLPPPASSSPSGDALLCPILLGILHLEWLMFTFPICFNQVTLIVLYWGKEPPHASLEWLGPECLPQDQIVLQLPS